MREVFFFSSFFFLFVSFLPFLRGFSLFFRYLFLLWRGDWNGREEEFFLFFFSFYFLFLGKQRGSNWKNLKEIRLLFLLNFRSFFFLFSLLIFSFWERKWREKRIKEFAFWRIKEICKNNSKWTEITDFGPFFIFAVSFFIEIQICAPKTKGFWGTYQLKLFPVFYSF